jgi:hypothetical protein
MVTGGSYKAIPGISAGVSYWLRSVRIKQTVGGNKSRQAGHNGEPLRQFGLYPNLAAIALRDMKTSDSAKTRADKAK